MPMFRTASRWPLLCALAGTLIACGAEETKPIDDTPDPPEYQSCRVSQSVGSTSCGTESDDWKGIFAGPSGADYDAQLADKARRFDRLFHALNAYSTGVNTELAVTDPADRDLVAEFTTANDGWDFEAFSGKKPEMLVGGWSKVAGAYAGVGIAADAFRYGTLREQGGECKELDLARDRLARDLDALHLASAITGVPGVIARGFIRTDVPGGGDGIMTTPLFDDMGNPLPAEKNNGTWRDDQSGEYPSYIWEDSCSRDQIVGWAAGYAAAWEVIADDPDFSDATKKRLKDDATAIVKSLMIVGEKGYDLEIHDADGRITYHGYMNENAIDRSYLEGANNGFMSLLSLGIVSALAYVAEDSSVYEWLYEQLGEARGLPEIARDSMIFVDLGASTNFSNYNMAFLGGLLAYRYHCKADVRSVVAEAIATSLYDNGGDRQPKEQQQSLYDLTFVLAKAESTAYQSRQSEPDAEALSNGVTALQELPAPPFWNAERLSCDDTEIMSGQCVGEDGTAITLLGNVGHNDELVAEAPVPMRIRPPSNYYWRSNPYAVNGSGDGTVLLPAVDFRFVYWLGRWSR